MNEYKLAWYNETNAEFHPVSNHAKPNDSPSFAQSMKQHIIDDAIENAQTALLVWGLTHMAQSQIDGPVGMGLRTAGRVALRAIPIIGTAYMAYSVYDWLTD